MEAYQNIITKGAEMLKAMAKKLGIRFFTPEEMSHMDAVECSSRLAEELQKVLDLK